MFGATGLARLVMSYIASYPDKNWDYDYDDGRIIWEGGSVSLTPQEAAIWGLLHKAYPHKVNNKKFINALYSAFIADDDIPDNPTGNVHVQACKIRRKLRLANAPFRIPYADYHGLWIEVDAVVHSG